MGAGDRPDFDAFVSYSHADKTIARRIQRFLEHHPLPTGPGAAPRRLRVFRDDTDIRAAQLTQELGAALARSGALVLCASPEAARSAWVQQELDLFLQQDGSRAVLPILVAGEPAGALPARLANAEIRHVDARGAWRYGWLSGTARDELLRVVASLAGEDLRAFIPWDRRRRRRWIAAGVTTLVALAVGALLAPFDRASPLGRAAAVAADSTLELCDVVDDRLVLAGRETYGRGTIEEPSHAGYVCVYPDALGKPRGRAWLDDSGYLPANRLLHVGAGTRVRKFAEGIDVVRLRAQARERLVEISASLAADRADDDGLEGGFWAAAPVPELQVVLVAFKPAAFDPAAVDGPPQGASVVAVRDGSGVPTEALLAGLSPPSPGSERRPPPRSVALGDGLPIAVTPRELLIGMPMRRDGGVGGLWRWDRVDRAWSRIALRGDGEQMHANLTSLAADPTRPGRVLATTAGGEWSWNARKGDYAAEIYERPTYDAPWRRVIPLPIESRSGAQLCGFTADGTLYARVDRSLFAAGRSNLMSMLLSRTGAADRTRPAPPSCAKRDPSG